MSFAHFPAMLVSETEGWRDIARDHPTVRKLRTTLVLPMSVLPPAMYIYAETVNPGAVFPLSVPALSTAQLMATGFVLFFVQIAMVSFMAMLIQRMAMAQDHDPGYENAYALAAIAPVPLWLSALALFVPSLAFNGVIVALAWLGSAALIRHGVRPLLKVDDALKCHYIANMVTFAGVCAWIGLMIVCAALLSILLSWWAI
ncbi:MAG TPA: Yip1 family protein [Rhodocyclaceae bacterium]|jgi:hypothetical protein|nr:Yip1 family protein [Rhodocyclaceae bacterium]HMV22049.1 Yip1 family protein [Rhodocyclaceae bacterium]HMW76304.1 Yip1 family protein [Rhodocyclaceae bacterium]HNE42398.1 Yip1 family protein [Rhodocyclaceae bacterium]HNL22592.1 Yip1 family protein [Rhodocyclaceae bacterium]